MKKIVLAVLLLLLGFALPMALIIALLWTQNEAVVFRGPGSQILNVEKPGQYFLWNQYSGMHEGKLFSAPEELPSGVTFILRANDSEKNFPIQPDSSYSSSMGDSQKRSIGLFELDQPGSYTLSITNLPEESLFSWSRSLFPNLLVMLGVILSIIFFVLGCLAGATVLLILGLIQLSKKSESASPSVPQGP